MSPGRRQIDEHIAGGVPTRSVLVRVVSAGRRIQRGYDEALSPFNISLDQCRILEGLRHAGSAGLDSQAFHELLRDVGADADDQTRLENEGWLELRRGGNRAITSQGRQLVADLDATLESVEERLAEQLGSEELAELARVTGKIGD